VVFIGLVVSTVLAAQGTPGSGYVLAGVGVAALLDGTFKFVRGDVPIVRLRKRLDGGRFGLVPNEEATSGGLRLAYHSVLEGRMAGVRVRGATLAGRWSWIGVQLPSFAPPIGWLEARPLPPGGDDRLLTGDLDFDSRIRLVTAHPATWSALLSRAARAALLRFADLAELGAHGHELRAVFEPARGDELVAAAKAGVAFVYALAPAAAVRVEAILVERAHAEDEAVEIRAAATVTLARGGWLETARAAARGRPELAIPLAAEGAPEDLDHLWELLRAERLAAADAARAGALLARFDAAPSSLLEPHMIIAAHALAAAAAPPARDVVASLAAGLLLVGTPAGAIALGPLMDAAPGEVAAAIAAIRERHPDLDVDGRLTLAAAAGALSLDDG